MRLWHYIKGFVLYVHHLIKILIDFNSCDIQRLSKDFFWECLISDVINILINYKIRLSKAVILIEMFCLVWDQNAHNIENIMSRLIVRKNRINLNATRHVNWLLSFFLMARYLKIINISTL